MNLVEQIESEEATRLTADKAIPDFSPGDTLSVSVRIREGERERIQRYEGVCIARSGSGINESFTVRKISFGEGVERIFPVLSPMIERIEVKRRGRVRRAKLYYLRNRRGKAARIPERTTGRGNARGRTDGKLVARKAAAGRTAASKPAAGESVAKKPAARKAADKAKTTKS